jgi:hypothetical protein
MKFLAAATSLGLLFAGNAFAQTDHALHHPGVAEARQAAADAKLHKGCRAVMGRQMYPTEGHAPARDRLGVETAPDAKGLSPAEMEAMHQKCQALLAKDAGVAPKP